MNAKIISILFVLCTCAVLTAAVELNTKVSEVVDIEPGKVPKSRSSDYEIEEINAGDEKEIMHEAESSLSSDADTEKAPVGRMIKAEKKLLATTDRSLRNCNGVGRRCGVALTDPSMRICLPNATITFRIIYRRCPCTCRYCCYRRGFFNTCFVICNRWGIRVRGPIWSMRCKVDAVPIPRNAGFATCPHRAANVCSSV